MQTLQAESDSPRTALSVDRSKNDLRAARLVVDLGVALHRFGAPSHHLEDAMTSASRQLGLEGRFFSLPTSVQATFVLADGSEHTMLRRLSPANEDLGRLAAADELLRSLISGTRNAAQTADALDELLRRENSASPLLRLLAHAAMTAAAARFFGGGAVDLVAAGILGLFGGLSEKLSARLPQLAPLQVAGLALLASLGASVGSGWTDGTLQVGVVMLAGVILLVPGLGLTVAMTEIATGHQASGTSRLTTALVQFALIGFGVAVGGRIGERFVVPGGLPSELPLWTLFASLLVAPLAIAVLMRSALRDVPTVLLAGWLAWGGARLGSIALDPQLGAAFGAMLVGATSNLLARIRRRPALVTFVPGMLLLVPGSLGFRSFTALLDHEVLQGVETAFTMVLVAAGLVSGALLGNVLVPPRQPL